MNKVQGGSQGKDYPGLGSEMMVLFLVVSLGGSDGDAAIVLELDNILGGEVVKEGIGLVNVLGGLLGSCQLLLELLDLQEPLSKCSVLVGVDPLLLLVV